MLASSKAEAETISEHGLFGALLYTDRAAGPLVAIERESGSVSDICWSRVASVRALSPCNRHTSSFSLAIFSFKRAVLVAPPTAPADQRYELAQIAGELNPRHPSLHVSPRVARKGLHQQLESPALAEKKIAKFRIKSSHASKRPMAKLELPELSAFLNAPTHEWLGMAFFLAGRDFKLCCC